MVCRPADPLCAFKTSQAVFSAESTNMKPLVASLPALMLVVRTVLSARAAKGDEWIVAAASSAAAIDLTDVLRTAPLPVLSAVTPEYYEHLYRTALAGKSTLFDCAVTNVSLDLFVDRLLSYGDVSESVLLIALIYLDRLMASTTQIVVNSSNIHKLFGTAFMLATKWQEDEYYSPTFFARLLGVSVEEINQLERHFLHALSYRLFVNPHDFNNAQVAFMGEAIDSPTGLSAFQRLRVFKVYGVDKALERAKTWHVVPVGDVTWHVLEEFRAMVSPSSVRVDFPSAGDPNYPADMTLPCSKSGHRRVSPSLAAIARAQLEHDFPQTGNTGLWLPDTNRLYSEGSYRRRDALTLLSQGIVANSWLPQLEYKEIPHAYLSHVMPVDNSETVECESFSTSFPDIYGHGSYNLFDTETPVVPQTRMASGFGDMSNLASAWGNTGGGVDWGYGANSNGFNAGGIGGIYAVPTIWTAR